MTATPSPAFARNLLVGVFDAAPVVCGLATGMLALGAAAFFVVAFVTQSAWTGLCVAACFWVVATVLATLWTLRKVPDEAVQRRQDRNAAWLRERQFSRGGAASVCSTAYGALGDQPVVGSNVAPMLSARAVHGKPFVHAGSRVPATVERPHPKDAHRRRVALDDDDDGGAHAFSYAVGGNGSPLDETGLDTYGDGPGQSFNFNVCAGLDLDGNTPD